MAGSEHGSFLFDVTDGVIVLHQLTFRIQSWPPTLSMTSRGPLEAFPDVDQPITPRVLRAVTDDVVQSRTIIYTVIAAPKRGQLRVKDARQATNLTSFTQHEVDDGTIVYRPLVNATDSPWNGVVDSIALEVSTAYATTLRDIVLPVNISYANLNVDNSHALIKSLPLRVVEDNVAPVTRRHLDDRPLLRHLAQVGVNDIVYIVVEEPPHGRLSVGRGNNAVSGYRLSRRDVVGGVIMYVHDGSDTTDDYFRFAVELQTAGSEVVGIDHVITVNVTIQPINDEPFELKTRSPKLWVLQVMKFQ